MTRVKKSKSLSIVMAGLDPAIQTAIEMFKFFLDGRVKHGHDEGEAFAALRFCQTPNAEEIRDRKGRITLGRSRVSTAALRAAMRTGRRAYAGAYAPPRTVELAV
jgi:hypothetical protein